MLPIIELAKEWLRLDQDQTTKNEILHLMAEQDEAALETRLRKRLTFGTAGLRARMEAGFSRINSLTIIQTSQGVAAYVLAQLPDADKRGIVIGFDGRHNSEKFAKLAAAAFVARGIKVWWLEELVHTPLVPFAINELCAAAGIMITASHNPPLDNGYKVYWGNGCQIIPPHDARISDAISAHLDPVTWDTSAVEKGSLVKGVLGQIRDAYFHAVAGACSIENRYVTFPVASRLRFVYTPMHGVGLPYMKRAVENLGLLPSMAVVPAQATADPDFPTVVFPNPEERGALDLAIQHAEEHGIDLVLANDPDADRFSVAEKVNGKWHQFTGNQVGILFASYVLEMHSPGASSASGTPIAMLASTVSSRMLSVMAAKEGFYFEETLTGFKWLGNIAKSLGARQSSSFDTVFAFEEAIGYMFPSVLYDKDGICAAAVFLSSVRRWNAQGLTPWSKLTLLYDRYGFFAEDNFYLISPDPELTNLIFAGIRASKSGDEEYPSRIGGLQVNRWIDLTEGFDSVADDGKPMLPVQRDAQMITVELENGVRFTARGSGTEPKIKIYIDAQGSSKDAAEEKVKQVRDILVNEWFSPEQYGLKTA
ncbi:MAG: Phosphoglucomutase-3 [Bogoriella megaspora]|nr:MAG: Phosphoglucomutase-3 [Bogoriella megaspora]